jgi:5-(aminomethyl)-3-furanmethanol phosphate kinase
MPFYVLKLGGSLMPVAKKLMRTLTALAEEEEYSFLVVPGGGPMADLVREIFSCGVLSQEAAHWMAILAMEQYAYFLADGTGAGLTREIRRPLGTPKIEILLPYQALQKDDFGLEHNWDYTSDSVAMLVASRLSAPLIKATDVDGVIVDGKVVEEVSSSSLLGFESCIDQGTLSLLCGRLKESYKESCVWVMNGTDPERFAISLKKGKGGTVIKGQ